MKRYVVHMHVGYVGMDGYEALVMPDEATEDEVQEEAYNMAVDHAARYGYYPPSEDDEYNDRVSDNIEGYAHPYDPRKHDQHRSGGGSFELDFRVL